MRGDDGVFFIGQVGWSPQFWKQSVPNDPTVGQDGKTMTSTSELKGLPGHYWVGGTFSPWSGFTEFGTDNKRAGSYGFYVHGDQMIFQEAPGSEQGLTIWAASGLYPQPSIAIVPFQVNVGVVYKGLIPGRDDDQTTFGYIYGNFSEHYARTVKAAGNGVPEYETVLETGYRIQLTKFAFLQPDVQWIIRPGGTGRHPRCAGDRSGNGDYVLAALQSAVAPICNRRIRRLQIDATSRSDRRARHRRGNGITF